MCVCVCVCVFYIQHVVTVHTWTGHGRLHEPTYMLNGTCLLA